MCLKIVIHNPERSNSGKHPVFRLSDSWPANLLASSDPLNIEPRGLQINFTPQGSYSMPFEPSGWSVPGSV